MSKLLALDQSSRITGYAIFDEGELIEYGKFEATHNDIGDRLVYIKNQILKIISDYKINEIIFEDVQMQNNVVNNVQTFKILAEVYGVVHELATELKIKNSSVLASSWKHTLDIKGKNRTEQKKNAQTAIKNIYNIKATQDEVDAIAIGHHHLQQNINDWSD